MTFMKSANDAGAAAIAGGTSMSAGGEPSGTGTTAITIMTTTVEQQSVIEFFR